MDIVNQPDPYDIVWNQLPIIETWLPKTIETPKELLSYFEFTVTCRANFRNYRWPIEFSFATYQSIREAIGRKIDREPEIPKLKKKEFEKKGVYEKLEFLKSILETLILYYFTYDEVREIFEISRTSFASAEKSKEGFVEKQVFGTIFQSTEKAWFHINGDWLDFYKDQKSAVPYDTLAFSKDFTIKSSRSNKIEFTSNQYEIYIETKSALDQALWEIAIKDALNKSERYNYEKRYDSSFPVRQGNIVRPYVDGIDYYSDLYDHLKAARKVICISDWWFSAKVYLKRPKELNKDSRLDRLLIEANSRNVNVYIILWQEITGSAYNNANNAIELFKPYPNIKVLTHPWHFLAKVKEWLGYAYWTHHEKMAIIDNEIVFMGGLDLCLGRWDTINHSLKDVEKPYLWTSWDYSNVRVKDFASGWENDESETPIDRNVIPRMPWHDIAMSVKGPVVKDILFHFRDRWNFIDNDTLGTSDAIATDDGGYNQSLHQATEFLSSELENAAHRVPAPRTAGDLNKMAAFVRGSYKDRFKLPDIPQERKAMYKDLSLLSQAESDVSSYNNGAECQLLISGCKWNLGFKVPEKSIMHAYIDLINNAEHFIYIENQFFVSSTAGEEVHNLVSQALTNRIIRAKETNQPFKIIVLVPLLPAFQGEIDQDGMSALILKQTVNWQVKTIHREDSETCMFRILRNAGIEPSDYIRFYSLRNHDQLSRPVTELIYIHCKAMVVDDKYAIIGSANINDRSLFGDRDSEVALVIKGSETVQGKMRGQDYDKFKVAHDLRVSLCMEHLGITDTRIVEDPFAEEFSNLWINTAKENTEFYRYVFGCYPDDTIQQYHQVQELKNNARLDEYDQRKGSVRGHLVEYPLNFLLQETLQSPFESPLLKNELFT